MEGETIISLSRRPTILNWRLTDFKSGYRSCDLLYICVLSLVEKKISKKSLTRFAIQNWDFQLLQSSILKNRQKMPFWADLGQPHDHIGWSTSMRNQLILLIQGPIPEIIANFFENWQFWKNFESAILLHSHENQSTFII